jgi:hypothetical protein
MMMAGEADDVHEVLRHMAHLASDFASEARYTLDSFDRQFIKEGRAPPKELLNIWRLRVLSWKRLIRAYAETARLEPGGREAVESYLASLLRYAEAVEPEDE